MSQKTIDQHYQEALSERRLSDALLVRDEKTGKMTPAYIKVKPRRDEPPAS